MNIEKYIQNNNLKCPKSFNDLLNLQDFYNKKIIEKKKQEIPYYRELDFNDIRNCILDEFQEFKRELPYKFNFKTYRYKEHNPDKQLEEYVDTLNFVLCKIIAIEDNYSNESWENFVPEKVLEKDKKTLEKIMRNFEYYSTQAEFDGLENRNVYPWMITYYLEIGYFFGYSKEKIYNQYWKKFKDNCVRENLE